MALGFGGMSMVQGAASNWAGLMALRFLIGVFEAGYGPGVAFFLSWFYSRQEMALRYGLFIGASAFANAMASSLAYGIVQAKAGISDWRLLFIVGRFLHLANFHLLTYLRGHPNALHCGHCLLPDSQGTRIGTLLKQTPQRNRRRSSHQGSR